MSQVFLSIVAPAYNESEGIKDLLTNWIQWLDSFMPNYEIVICDDGSSDNTWEILEELSQLYPKLKNIRFLKNHGAAVAHAAALKNSIGKWVLMLDSDGQFKIEDTQLLFKKQKETQSLAVIGERSQKQDSFLNQIGSRLSTITANILLGTKFKDFNSIFKLIDGEIARNLSLDASSFEISTDVTAKLVEQGICISSITISHNKREFGTSKLKFISAAIRRYKFIMYLHHRSKLIRKKIIKQNIINQEKIIRGRNYVN